MLPADILGFQVFYAIINYFPLLTILASMSNGEKASRVASVGANTAPTGSPPRAGLASHRVATIDECHEIAVVGGINGTLALAVTKIPKVGWRWCRSLS